MEPQVQREFVSSYYGETLKSSADLRSSACCPLESVPADHKKILSKLHPDVVSRFYGCGSPIPEFLEGATVLDLGCGTGRDAYLASALVGPNGNVIGVDMTDSQLDVARAHQRYHAKAFFDNEQVSNVDFRKGFIEDLASSGVSDSSIDVVISNCVCNLSPHKEKVFSEIYRVLKRGGEFYFSDVYADRRLSEEATKNPVLVAECLGGALYLEDFRRVMAKVGFFDIRVISAAPVSLKDCSLAPLVPSVTFYSVTVRAFKLSELNDRREDYAQNATYLSTSDTCVSSFKLDVDNIFQPNVAQPIDSNTASILKASRFRPYFLVSEAGPHRGLYRRPRQEPVFSQALDCFRPPLLYGSHTSNADKQSSSCKKKTTTCSASKCNVPSSGDGKCEVSSSENGFSNCSTMKTSSYAAKNDGGCRTSGKCCGS